MALINYSEIDFKKSINKENKIIEFNKNNRCCFGGTTAVVFYSDNKYPEKKEKYAEIIKKGDYYHDNVSIISAFQYVDRNISTISKCHKQISIVNFPDDNR